MVRATTDRRPDARAAGFPTEAGRASWWLHVGARGCTGSRFRRPARHSGRRADRLASRAAATSGTPVKCPTGVPVCPRTARSTGPSLAVAAGFRAERASTSPAEVDSAERLVGRHRCPRAHTPTRSAGRVVTSRSTWTIGWSRSSTSHRPTRCRSCSTSTSSPTDWSRHRHPIAIRRYSPSNVPGATPSAHGFRRLSTQLVDAYTVVVTDAIEACRDFYATWFDFEVASRCLGSRC